MRKHALFLVLGLWLAGTCAAAITEKYVTADAGGGGNGSSGTPWTLAEAIAGATAGMRVNVKAGAYSVGTSTLPTGTAADPIWFRGYNDTIGGLDGQTRTAATGLVNTANMPAITITGLWTPGAFCILQNLNITGALSSALIGSTTIDDCYFVNCSITNTQSNSGARAVQCDDRTKAINCDFTCTQSSHASVVDCDNSAMFYACRFKSASTSACLSTNFTASVGDCVFYGNAGSTGIDLVATNTDLTTIRGCTFYGIGTCIQTVNAAVVGMVVISNCHATDATKWIDNLYAATDNIVVFEFCNRTRDIGTMRTGVDQGCLAAEVTTDGGGAETDYSSAGTGDFRLIYGAPGKSAGLMPNVDCGALQRVENTFPAAGNVLLGSGTYGDVLSVTTPSLTLPSAANVWYGSGTYGNPSSPVTPTKRASSITNCSAGNIKLSVVIDDVTGTYAAAGGLDLPEPIQIGG